MIHSHTVAKGIVEWVIPRNWNRKTKESLGLSAWTLFFIPLQFTFFQQPNSNLSYAMKNINNFNNLALINERKKPLRYSKCFRWHAFYRAEYDKSWSCDMPCFYVLEFCVRTMEANITFSDDFSLINLSTTTQQERKFLPYIFHFERTKKYRKVQTAVF